MLEIIKLKRYEHAPVLRFGPGFDAQLDASQFAAWLAEFVREKGRPPTRFAFTFHAADKDADDLCRFMKLCAGTPAIADVLAQAAVELTFAGSMSESVMLATQQRIASQTF